MIHLYYGYGKGKTTSAIGAGIRAYGAGMSVLLVQFFKDNRSSELNAVPFDVVAAPDSLPFNPGEAYRPWVDNAISVVKNSDADMIILDEFLDLIPEYISASDAVNLLSDSSREYIIIGHKRADELFDIADYVTKFEKEKHPYDKGALARKGIEF